MSQWAHHPEEMGKNLWKLQAGTMETTAMHCFCDVSVHVCVVGCLNQVKHIYPCKCLSFLCVMKTSKFLSSNLLKHVN